MMKKKEHNTGNDVIERTPADPLDCVLRSISLKMSDNLTFL